VLQKTTLLVLSIVAVLLLQAADCMSAMTPDKESMQCCGSMPCDPSNESHDCCKAMVSSQAPSLLPVTHVTLKAPAMVFENILVSPQVIKFPEVSLLDFAAPQHSPPELYTLHASLLI
jgi:hypothetical protein